MIFKSLSSTLIGLSLALTASVANAQTPAPTKVAVIDIQQAIATTEDGKKAGADMKISRRGMT